MQCQVLTRKCKRCKNKATVKVRSSTITELMCSNHYNYYRKQGRAFTDNVVIAAV